MRYTNEERGETQFMTLPHRPVMTVEEYFVLDQNNTGGRYEYIDGYIRLLAGGTPDHSQIGTNFANVLYMKLEGRRCRTFNSDVYVQLSETQYVHPDVSVSCDERDRTQSKIIQHPCLVVEVLSPSTESYDVDTSSCFIKHVLVYRSMSWSIQLFSGLRYSEESELIFGVTLRSSTTMRSS